jgi:hypothetical protein
MAAQPSSTHQAFIERRQDFTRRLVRFVQGAQNSHRQGGVHRGGQAFAENVADVKSHVAIVHQKNIDEVSTHEVNRLKFMSDGCRAGARNLRGGSIKLWTARASSSSSWRSFSIARASTAGEMVSM